MLPANVILTNRLINSSEAKDNSKVTQLAWHIWENMREILSRAGRVRSRFITTQPCLNVSLRPAIREMASSSVYVSSPWDELVVCLSTSVCLRFHLRNDSMCVCVCLCLAFFFPFLFASARLFKHTCSIIWLCTPWHCALALDLLTSFPDCYNHPSEPSMDSNIMVICRGHCC